MKVIKTEKNYKNAVLIAVCLLAGLATALLPLRENSTPASAKVADLFASDNAQRVAFIKSNGWQCEKEPFEITEILIPTEFTSIYHSYEALQKSQGLSLEAYRGKRAVRYSYKIKNNSSKTDAVAELVVIDEKIVACAVLNTEKNIDYIKLIS
ncbi:MAG: DUF4830 domain-containing protein [Ruminococcaceae bacterium]|nr:DUF4830 domain-containing protein [Oscillospiraceae bacterium]